MYCPAANSSSRGPMRGSASVSDSNGLPLSVARGLAIFRGKAGCPACHSRPTLSDELFHNTSVAWHDGQWTDLGRFSVTGVSADRGVFKTPTLREIARTAPYTA